MGIPSPALRRRLACAVCLASRAFGSSRWFGAQKKPPAAAAAECEPVGMTGRYNPHFTKRFAYYVGRCCRQASVRDVAKELKLTWDTVKALEMQYMRAQIERAGTPGPRAIGIDHPHKSRKAPFIQ